MELVVLLLALSKMRMLLSFHGKFSKPVLVARGTKPRATGVGEARAVVERKAAIKAEVEKSILKVR